MSRIAVTEEYLRTQAIPTAKRMRDPHRTLTDVTVRAATPTPPPQATSVPVVRPEELTFNQTKIEVDAYLPPCDQVGGTLTTLSVLLGSDPQAKKLIAAALNEARLLGAPSHA